jgi:hypothetical protein
VPELRPVRSRVTPEGTATDDMMIVEHEILDLLADDAPPDPEKVHVVALFSRFGAAVGAGVAAGAASAKGIVPRITLAMEVVKLTMLKRPLNG